MSADRSAKKTISRAESIQNLGMDICSPISGSMLPMIRPRRDSVLFVVPSKRLKRYDVALYKRETVAVMHRVIKAEPGGYIMRGDNGWENEWVEEDRVFGVMKGFYRDERYIPAEDKVYRCYVRLWVNLNPVVMILKRIKRKIKGIFAGGRL